MKQAALITIVLLMAAILYFIFTLPPREMTIKDLHPVLLPHSSQNEAVQEDTAAVPAAEEAVVKVADIPDAKEDQGKSGADFFIIIGSFRDPAVARQKADKLGKELHAVILVLPAAANGYCRISYGKYSSLEEARTALKSVKAKIKPDAWIFAAQK